MPKGLRGIRGKDTIKAFIRAGGELRPGKGDHLNIKMPNGMIVTIPGSEELRIGLLKACDQEGGIDRERIHRPVVKGETNGIYGRHS